MGNCSFSLNENFNYGHYDEFIIDETSIMPSFDNKDVEIEHKISDYKRGNLFYTISEAEALLKKLMDMKFHTKRIIEKYNSLATLFEEIHCKVCYLDIAQRWVYQQDCNQLYKCCIELEARIAEQSESIKNRYSDFCDFIQLDKSQVEEINAFINYPGLTTCLVLNRKCRKCSESKTISQLQAKNAAFMAYKIQGILSFYEYEWDEIISK
ncbi:hypothetical protein HWI79_1480 [Cryptosporidium felis]|nr:hypothetical protein HWI79_1480 [Cryptosporidium felis]